ncbi:MAG: lysophospholipid acyltransferase family protein [Deltaproteobacteria bacterium]|nr:lysophospholipid acyltransferase family protein [Deltaproteobacteria bacterium]
MSEKEKKPVVHFLQYAFFQVFLRLIRLLPLGVATWVGKIIGRTCAFLSPVLTPKMKHLAIEDMREAFTRISRNDQGMTRQEASVKVTELYKNLGMSIVEFARIGTLTKERVNKVVSFEGIENLRIATESGQAVIILSAHFGSWELLNAALALNGFPLHVVARPLDNKYFDKFITAQRSAFGGGVIEREGALRGMLKVLKNKEILGILLDQRPPKKDAVMVDYFSRPAPTGKGLAAVAMKTHALVLPIFIVRDTTAGLEYQHKIICEPPVEIANTGDKEADLKENTRRFTFEIEKIVTKHPEQWLWFHSRWIKRRRKNGSL